MFLGRENEAIRCQPVWVLVVAGFSLKLSPNQLGEIFIGGGLTILRYLFLVGLFLGFIKMLGEIGTFASIAKIVSFLHRDCGDAGSDD